MQATVLITSFGSNTAIGVAKAMRLSNFPIKIIGTDTNRPNQCAGFEFADVIIQIPPYSAPDYKLVMKQIIIDHRVDCVIPIYDKEIEVIAEMAEEMPALTGWAVNSINLIQTCNNKPLINELLSNVVTVPKMFSSVSTAQFPFIIKEINGISSKGVRIYNNHGGGSELREGEFIQEFISGIEYTVDCYSSYIDSNVFQCVIRERTETKSGMSVKGKIVSESRLEQQCRSIHQKLGYKGASNIQFIEENGIFHFIEINPRFAGGGILSYRFGCNMPLYSILELVERRIPEDLKNPNIEIGTQMVRYLTETYFNSDDNYIGS